MRATTRGKRIEAVEHAEAKEVALAEKAARTARRRANRGDLPAHLPPVRIVIDVENATCHAAQAPCTASARTCPSASIVPVQVRVLVNRRPKYACRACENAVVQVPAPTWLIDSGLPTDGTVAQVFVSTYAEHLPLYHKAQISARQSFSLNRSTLSA